MAQWLNSSMAQLGSEYKSEYGLIVVGQETNNGRIGLYSGQSRIHLAAHESGTLILATEKLGCETKQICLDS